MRNVTGAALAVIGAAVTLVSPWQSWYAGRHGSTYKFWEVFGSGITAARSGIMDSVFLVFLVTAIITVIGAILRSKAIVLVGAVIALGFSILWMIRQGNAAGQLVVTTNGSGIGQGVAWALGGSALMLAGGLMMHGRPKEQAATTHRRRTTTAGEPVAATDTASTATTTDVADRRGTSTKAYDSGRSDAMGATDRPTTTTGSRLTPEEQAEIDRLSDEPPKS